MRDETTKRKKEGFQGQKAIVIPKRILSAQCEKNEIASPLYITDIGYYPKAKFHYRERNHGTDQHILIYCIEGKGSVRIDKTVYTVKADDFLVVPSLSPHQYAADENDPWTIYWVHFKGNVSEPIILLALTRLGGHKGFVHYKEDRIHLFNTMYDTLERGYKSDNLIYVNMTLWHYLTTFIFMDKMAIAEESSGTRLIDKAIDFMSQKTEEVVNLDEIAKTVNLSPSHFSSLFKKKTGFSPIEYFNYLKVQKRVSIYYFRICALKRSLIN